uniref:Uncharacterized protein n=1 Tax=Panagrolaimus superbus TaxID=310955 RepID=A0A914Z0R9_9BILA
MFKKIDPDSETQIPSPLDLFVSKPVNVAFQDTNIVEYSPLNSNGAVPIRFSINSGSTYLDLSQRRLGIETSRNFDDLELGGFAEDDETTQTSGVGFEKRRNNFIINSEFNTIAHLDVDFFKQKKFLLNETLIDIELTPNNTDFMLIVQDKTTYSLAIIDYKLYVKQHHILPQIDEQIQISLKTDSLAKYPYTRNIVNTHYISSGRYDYKATLFNDFIPKRIFVALVDGKAFNGTLNTSPFEFKQFNIQNIHISANGKLMPNYPYDLDKHDFSRCFKDLVETTENTGLSYEEYLTHTCIFAFDFQSHPLKNVSELQRIGTTALSIKFSKAVPIHGIQVIVYTEFDSLIAFDYSRNMTTSFPV